MQNPDRVNIDLKGVHKDFHSLCKPKVLSAASVILVLVIAVAIGYAFMQMGTTPLLTVILFAIVPLGIMAAIAVIMDMSAAENLKLYRQYTSAFTNTAPTKHLFRVSKGRSEHGYILFADVEANGKLHKCEIIAHSDPIDEGVFETQADIYFSAGQPVVALIGDKRFWLEDCPFRLGAISV